MKKRKTYRYSEKIPAMVGDHILVNGWSYRVSDTTPWGTLIANSVLRNGDTSDVKEFLEEQHVRLVFRENPKDIEAARLKRKAEGLDGIRT